MTDKENIDKLQKALLTQPMTQFEREIIIEKLRELREND